MRKRVLSAFFLTLMFAIVAVMPVYAEEITYPFDSITIVSAFKFDVECTDAPVEESYLYGHVEAGETISIYVGTIMFAGNDSPSRIVIISNEADEDIARWIVNGSGFDTETQVEGFSFSSHITVNPTVGVVKNMNEFTYIAEVTIDYDTDECTFTAKHWDETIYGTYTMIAGTFEEITDLNIVISAYEEA